MQMNKSSNIMGRERKKGKEETRVSEERVREEASCSHWIRAHLAMSFMGRGWGGARVILQPCGYS